MNAPKMPLLSHGVKRSDDETRSSMRRDRADDMNRLLDAIVMMIDDEPLNVEVTQIHLEEAGYNRFVSTCRPLEALAMMRDAKPDVLLLDLMMPELSGFEILEQMECENILKDIPTIVLTSSSDAGTKLKALELGATDFLAKPVDASELVLRLRNTLAAKAYRDRLANFDLLTGLPNRKTFMERLERALQNAARNKQEGAVLQIGIDKFKEVNEALGPGFGDAVLQGVANRLENCLRTTDTVLRLENGPRPSLSRFAGDEFIILLPLIRKSDDAVRIAERVLGAIGAPFRVRDHELMLTCTIGVAVFPADGSKADTLVQNAAAAMHHAKTAAKNTFQFYSAELNSRALAKLNLASELRRAIDRDELRIHYQAKADVQSGFIVGAEALVRWHHPQRGMIAPGEFVPLAEENGLIVPLGEWVMHAACKQARAWQIEGKSVPRVAINVSSHQFRSGKLRELVLRVLSEVGLAGSLITLELTEGVLIDGGHASMDLLNEIKSMGVKLSIDDFGTGYSSLSYLDRFPLDELKIDRSFIARITRADDRASIVTAIIAMAHSLDLRVVAEGVENEAQLAFLKMHRCDEYQGYLKAKPLPAEEFATRFLSAI
jgi:diguanylate cyclase